MPSTAPRYSVTIQIDEKLRKLKRETHDLCCAWGFRRDGSAETTYNIVGWASSTQSIPFTPQLNLTRNVNIHNVLKKDNITSKESIDWTERYWVSASKEGCDPGCKSHPQPTASLQHPSLNRLTLPTKSWST